MYDRLARSVQRANRWVEGRDERVECLLIGVMSRKTGAYEWRLAEVVPTMYIGSIRYKGLDSLLARKTGSDVQCTVSLIINDPVYIKGGRCRSIVGRLTRRNFPEKVENRHRVITLAYRRDDRCPAIVFRRS